MCNRAQKKDAPQKVRTNFRNPKLHFCGARSRNHMEVEFGGPLRNFRPELAPKPYFLDRRRIYFDPVDGNRFYRVPYR